MLNTFRVNFGRCVDKFIQSRAQKSLAKKSLGQASVSCIIFSKDRPMQLHALLQSMALNVDGIELIQVIYAASNPDFEVAYETVIRLNQGANLIFVNESKSDASFSKLVTRSLGKVDSHATFFLVDDIVFTRRIDIQAAASLATETCIPSLRLGLNIRHNYMTQTALRKPPLRKHKVPPSGPTSISRKPECAIYSWNWGSGEGDWGYPLSLDGNIFTTSYLRNLLRKLFFNSPNTLEQAMQCDIKSFVRRIGICGEFSMIVNLPINRVQQDFNNSFGTIHQNELLSKWREGYSIDITEMLDLVNVSVHQDIPIKLKLQGS